MKRISNPPSPWDRYSVELLGEAPPAELEVYEETARSILSENESPDIGFRWSINPYRGCFHACAYCYARPTHQYLEYGAGTDFERKLVAKVNAPELLRAAFMKKSWAGELIMFSGITDCYQPLEATYEITKRCLEVCLEFRNPVRLISKSALIQRDVELFKALHEKANVRVHISVAFADDKMARAIEPGAPLPSVRMRALKVLSDAGVPTGVAIAPMIPGLNDSQMPEVLERAKENGATEAFINLIRLPAEVKPVFIERLEAAFPQRASKVLNAIKGMRGGELYKSTFHSRMVGDGERWHAIQKMFELTCKKLGMNGRHEEEF